MCDANHSTDISRRHFAGMALAGAGLAMWPLGARAAQTDNFALMCIDYRLVSNAINFFNHDPGPGEGDYDLVALAGASLAGASPKMFRPTVHGFWQQVGAARKLHEIKKVFVLDHMSCGAFAEEFNKGKPLEPDDERDLHIKMMRRLRAEFIARERRGELPKLELEFYLMAAPIVGPQPPPERMHI